MLGTLSEHEKSHLKDFVKRLVHAYNCTWNDVTGVPPYNLLFGRLPRLPVDLAFGLPTMEHQHILHTEYVQNQKTHLKYKVPDCNRKC